jgi:chaperone modulatory protein CbpM
MTEIKYIALKEFCAFHQVDHTVVFEVADRGLVELTKRPDDYYLPEKAVAQLERILRLHTDLGINMPGIETIMHMRQRMIAMHEELEELRRQVREFALIYEREDPDEM